MDTIVHPLQAELWQILGGIGERWNEPEDTWLLNHNAALTAELAASDPTDVIAATSWAWEEDGLKVPIEPSEYGVLAEEVNGNLTLCHRTTGEILLFALTTSSPTSRSCPAAPSTPSTASRWLQPSPPGWKPSPPSGSPKSLQ